MNRDIVIKWIDLAYERLSAGEEVYIHTETTADQKTGLKAIRKELDILSKVDPIRAIELTCYPTFKDHRNWLVIKKIPGDPTVGFIKRQDGASERVEIEHSERRRRLALMIDDGLLLKEILDLEDDLNEEDLAFISNRMEGRV